MSENIGVDKNLNEEEKYKLLLPQLEGLISPDDPIISNLANVTAALKETFEKISWVGFYLAKENKLHLGPFQGKVACTLINFGSGVCGTSAEKKSTIIVENVHEFPGHIACDSGSNSEIVIPLIYNDGLLGVLDLDSYSFNAFSEIDSKYLSKLIDILVNKLSWSKSIL